MGLAVKIKETKGFSLVELMIVIALLAILSCIAAFAYGKYKQRLAFRNVARALVADFNYLKQKAIAEAVHYKITFDIANNCYSVVKGGPKGLASEYDYANALVRQIHVLGENVIISPASASQLSRFPNSFPATGHFVGRNNNT